MCNFFSFVSDGHGRVRYFNWEQRKKIINGKLVDGNGYAIRHSDSHSSIMAYYGIYGKDEDKWNKYEYNPLTYEFTVDQMNTHDDISKVSKWVRGLDFKTIVEPLVIKPIVDPRYVKKHEVDSKVLKLFYEWIEVYGLIQNEYFREMELDTWETVYNSVWKNAGVFVFRTLENYFEGGLTLISVNDFITVYASSFLSAKPFQCAVDLWEMGFVLSYGEKTQTWRLHQGENMEVVYERKWW